MTKKTTKESAEFADLSEIALYYFKYWKWFVLSIIVCATLAFIYFKSQPPVYLTKSNILVKTEDSRPSALSSNAVKNLGFGGLSSSENIDDEMHVIASHSITKQMVYELGIYKTYTLKKFPFDKSLYNNSPVVINLPKTYVDTLSKELTFRVTTNNSKIKITAKYDKIKLGEFESNSFPASIETQVGSFIFNENPEVKNKDSFDVEITVSGLDHMAEEYMEKVEISTASKKANIIQLIVRDNEKQRGKDVLNKLVALYNIDALDDKNKMALNTANFIKERIDTISIELNAIEKGIEKYKRENDIIDISGETEASLEKVVELKEKSLEYEIQLSFLEMLEKHINAPENKYELMISSSEMPKSIETAMNDYNLLILERSHLLKNASETNPAVTSLDLQLNMLRENVKTSMSNIRKEISLAKQDWTKIQNTLQSRLKEVPRQERQFLEIRRQQEIKAELYIFLLQKLQEAELTLASNTPKAKIVDAAYTEVKPVAPKGLTILAIGILIGGILPLIIIYLRDLFKPYLANLDELERFVNIPVLGEICNDKSGEKIVVGETSTTSTAELFRLIRSNLQFTLNGANEKVILVTSSVSGEGKSFFTINLAASLSLIKDKKVILVGLDIRNPKLTEYLSIRANNGVTSYLSSDDYKPEDIIMGINKSFPNLYFAPSGPIPPNPSELLLSDRLNKFFDYLRDNFDYVIVDTAPVGMVSDTFTLAKVSDATIYLFRANYTNKSHLKLANSITEENRLKKVHLVMNGTKTKTGYGYGYGNKSKE